MDWQNVFHWMAIAGYACLAYGVVLLLLHCGRKFIQGYRQRMAELKRMERIARSQHPQIPIPPPKPGESMREYLDRCGHDLPNNVPPMPMASHEAMAAERERQRRRDAMGQIKPAGYVDSRGRDTTPPEGLTCGYQPADKRYQPCTRAPGHPGPCAHPWHDGLRPDNYPTVPASLGASARNYRAAVEAATKAMQAVGAPPEIAVDLGHNDNPLTHDPDPKPPGRQGGWLDEMIAGIHRNAVQRAKDRIAEQGKRLADEASEMAEDFPFRAAPLQRCPKCGLMQANLEDCKGCARVDMGQTKIEWTLGDIRPPAYRQPGAPKDSFDVEVDYNSPASAWVGKPVMMDGKPVGYVDCVGLGTIEFRITDPAACEAIAQRIRDWPDGSKPPDGPPVAIAIDCQPITVHEVDVDGGNFTTLPKSEWRTLDVAPTGFPSLEFHPSVAAMQETASEYYPEHGEHQLPDGPDVIPMTRDGMHLVHYHCPKCHKVYGYDRPMRCECGFEEGPGEGMAPGLPGGHNDGGKIAAPETDFQLPADVYAKPHQTHGFVYEIQDPNKLVLAVCTKVDVARYIVCALNQMPRVPLE